jgi:predicted metal-dependent HD superfamily phosphohydrolase
VQDLMEQWRALLARHSTADPDLTGRALLACWAEPHRRYHDLAHLREVLAAVDDLAAYATDADAVRLAGWYHDAVYAGRSDDEEQSARKAEVDLAALGVPAVFIAEVARLIRMTIGHDPSPGDRNGEALSDADLAALAVPAERYRHNSVAIRRENAHVPAEEFRAARARAVRSLLAGTALYRTPLGRQRWEQAARANLTAELAALTGPPADL